MGDRELQGDAASPDAPEPDGEDPRGHEWRRLRRRGDTNRRRHRVDAQSLSTGERDGKLCQGGAARARPYRLFEAGGRQKSYPSARTICRTDSAGQGELIISDFQSAKV